MGRITDDTLFRLIRDFLNIHLPKQRNCSTHTIKAYRRTLNAFLDYIKEDLHLELYQLTLDAFNSTELTNYLDSLETSGNCINTRNHRMNCIRAFCAYAAKTEPSAVPMAMDIQKVPRKKGESAVIEYMSPDAVKALMETPDTTTKLGLRDQFMMVLFYDTGARIQEVLSLRICDIKVNNHPTATICGKGSKTRTVPLLEKTVAHFQNYCKAFHPDYDEYSTDYVFYVVRNGTKKRMTDDNVRKTMRKYAETAHAFCKDVPTNIHPHLWRHSRAMHLYQNGMDLTLYFFHSLYCLYYSSICFFLFFWR